MKFTKEVYEALVHVRQFYPEIIQVVYNSNGLWNYATEFFDKQIFDMQKINIEILENAQRSVTQFPAVFDFWQYK